MIGIINRLGEALGFAGNTTTSLSIDSLVDETGPNYSEVLQKGSVFEEDVPCLNPEADASEDAEFDHQDISEEAPEEISASYEGWLEGDVDRLHNSWTELQSDTDSDVYVRHFFLTAHNLKGTARGFGNPTIARLCCSLCLLLERKKITEDMALINLHVDACKAALLQGSGAKEIANAVCTALELQVARRAA